jgi:hypothetical protein
MYKYFSLVTELNSQNTRNISQNCQKDIAYEEYDGNDGKNIHIILINAICICFSILIN